MRSAPAPTSSSQRTSDHKLILKVRTGIGYDVDWRQVHELMLAAAEHTRRVTRRPEPTPVGSTARLKVDIETVAGAVKKGFTKTES